MKNNRAGGLVALGSSTFFAERKQIMELAAQNRLPSMASFREYVETGGLMEYGANLHESFRRSATYVDKILKGTKPADRPVEQPTKLERVINLKIAKALRLTIPQSVLACGRGDSVAESIELIAAEWPVLSRRNGRRGSGARRR